MPGSVVMVKKNAGEAVSEGEVIAVIEAMKMEYPLVAPFVGQVESIAVSVGAQVTRGQIVAIVVPAEGAS
jgi:acetyl-CoA/propionyl-CoA carboxylase biotin carboxyl carrier protein